LLGIAQDAALARRALDLVKASDFTDQQRVSLLAAVASAHPDLAFDFALANAATVSPLIETSSRSSFFVGLAAGSNDPAIVGKIEGYAAQNAAQNAAAKTSAERTINGIRNRTVFADRLRPAVTAWAGR
jgi:aminopeptidase N